MGAPQPTGKSWELKLWISTQANYSLTKHTSHHQPKPLKVKIHPHPFPTSFAISHNQLLVSHPPRALLIGLISLIELRLGSMWESGLVASQDCTQPVISLCSITTTNIYNNKCPRKLLVNLRGQSWKKKKGEVRSSLSALVEPVLSDRHPAAETSFSRPLVGVISQNMFHSTHP